MMNREIKFRGKRIDNGEWVYGNLIYSSDACKEYETLIIPQKDADGFTTDYASNGENKESYGFDNWFCVIPETVGQYTGLKDKNGKEIYEGDIVEKTYYSYHQPECSELFEIKYEGLGFYFEHIKGNAFYLPFTEDIEIIGNIYENPELINKEEN